MMIKYLSYVLNTRKNNKNLKFNNKLEIATIERGGFPLTNHMIAVIVGKANADNSINNK